MLTGIAGRYTTNVMPQDKLQVREVTDEELRANTRVSQEEYRKLLELAMTKNLEIDCKQYREARVMAQRITACRSFYGFDVKVMHRGTKIFLTPRNTVAIDMLPAGDEPEQKTTSKLEPKK